MPMDTAGSAVWTVGRLVAAVSGSGGTNTRVEIPRFQRHLVWKDEQRVRLIDSIHRGYPIGAILLYKKPTPGEVETYQVVDGLQRTSTLVQYVASPLTFAPIQVVDEDLRRRLAAERFNTGVDHLNRALLDWMRATRRLTFAAGYQPASLAAHLRAALDRPLPAGATDEGLVADLGQLLDDVARAVDISSVSLPVVTYNGHESELPEIFERVNQSGTKLSKYEVFAATWLNTQTHVNDAAIRVAVNDKYTSLLSRGYAISGLEADKAIQDFNLFEYLFGFGKLLVKQNPLLFGATSDAAEAEPAAFSLASSVQGLHLGRMAELPAAMPRAADGVIDPTMMGEALLTAAAAVSGWLRPYLGLKLNSTAAGVTDVPHGELQIVSLIARAAAGRWHTRGDWSERLGWREDWAALKRAAPQHYLVDLLEETWRGPLYSLLHARVWGNAEQDDTSDPAAYYTKPLMVDELEPVLDGWFAKQMGREQRSRPHVRAVERAFLRFVYTGLVTFLEDGSHTFELEHLFPVSRLRAEIPEDAPGWPISCIANLALFTKAMNRESSALTISEFLEKKEVSPADREQVERLLLCDVGDVVIPADGLNRTDYESFLRKRWLEMKRQLILGLRMGEVVPSPASAAT